MPSEMAVFPAWADINLGSIAHNIRELRRVTKPEAMFMAVVKANAYGHGSVEVSRVALANGADWLGVARVAEGAALRREGIEAPILILGFTPEEQYEDVLRWRLVQTVYTRDMAVALAEAAVRKGTKARVHFKVDTGMGRLGWLSGPGAIEEILELAGSPGLEVEGILTHFAASDAADKSYTLEQYHKFLDIIEILRRRGLEFAIKHSANSAALMEMPETHLDMVRAGIAIYGLYPSDEVDRGAIALQPALSLKARVAHVKKVDAGFKVSYGCTYTTARPTVIATLPLGYADGYSRLLSSRGEALIHGRRAPVVGRVCMDQIMVDVGHIPGVKMADEAVLIGCQGADEIPADEVARKIHTINYEVVCMINHRVPRIYYNGQ